MAHPVPTKPFKAVLGAQHKEIHSEEKQHKSAFLSLHPYIIVAKQFCFIILFHSSLFTLLCAFFVLNYIIQQQYLGLSTHKSERIKKHSKSVLKKQVITAFYVEV
jgi:hypothetical protein